LSTLQPPSTMRAAKLINGKNNSQPRMLDCYGSCPKEKIKCNITLKSRKKGQRRFEY